MARRKRDDWDEDDEYTDSSADEREERTDGGKPTKKEKIAYEKELVKEGKILPRYSPRNPFGRILLLILVFFFGIFAAIGGIIGTFAYLGTRPVKEGFNLFNIPYDQYLTEDASNLSVLEIVQKAQDWNNNFNSLEAISGYTPLVDGLLDKIDEQLTPVGIRLDKNELKATPFSEIGAYFSENVLQSIVLGDVLGITPDSDALFITLCYGEEGVDYVVETNAEGVKSFKMQEGHSPLTVKDIPELQINELLGKVTVESALGVTAGSDIAMRYLAYGSLGTHYELHTEGETTTVVMLNDENGVPYKKKTVSSLTEEGADLLGSAKISDLVNTEGAGSVLNAISDWTISDMGSSDKFMSLTMNDVLGDSENLTGIVKTLSDKGWTFKQLSEENVLNSLKISEIIDIGDDGGILGAMKDWEINDLSNSFRIERLKISQFLTPGDDPLMNKISQWRIGDMSSDKFNTLTLSDVITLGENPPKILATLSDIPLGECATAIDNMRLSDVLDGDLSGNMLLKNLQSCTLTNLADELQALTVADIFGDDAYTYMRIGTDSESGSKITYASAVRDYEEGHKEQSTSYCVINDLYIDFEELNGNADGKKYFAESYTVLKANETEVKLGTFEKTGANYTLLASNIPVYESTATVGETTVKSLYIERELRLTPVYLWKTVDYANKTLAPLPEGDSVSPSYGDRENGSPARENDTPYMQNGAPMYYLSADKYYPVYEDAYSCYYITTDGTRVDLDRSVTGYKTQDDVELTLNDGKVTYLNNDYFVRSKGAGDTVYDYILEKIAVEQFYYADNGSADGIYAPAELHAESETEERYRLMVEQNGVITKEDDLDRFLDGVWYLLFGGEVRDADGKLVLDGDGNITVIDNTSKKLTDIAGLITDVSGLINDSPLWKLYLHGIIEENPYVMLTPTTNMNELTISGLIKLLASSGGAGA